MNTGIEAIAAERKRQIEQEGFTAGRDDLYAEGQLCRAAAAYAYHAGEPEECRDAEIPFDGWPWDVSWWKPGSPREELVKAGALIAAEIDRLDRLAAKDLKQFSGSFHVMGRCTAIVMAENKKEARKKLEEMADNAEFGVDLDDADCVDLDWISEIKS